MTKSELQAQVSEIAQTLMLLILHAYGGAEGLKKEVWFRLVEIAWTDENNLPDPETFNQAHFGATGL